tara:strand:- start:6446 stop:6676 length:231 start_codon:yes stop_codon:yes gene_type:complete
MITKDDIKPGFKFKTHHDSYVVDHVKNDYVYLRYLYTDYSRVFKWATVDNAVSSLNTDSYFQVISCIPNFKYVEEL